MDDQPSILHRNVLSSPVIEDIFHCRNADGVPFHVIMRVSIGEATTMRYQQEQQRVIVGGIRGDPWIATASTKSLQKNADRFE